MKRSMRRRFRKILLASTLALLGATGPTHAQETTPIHATQAQKTFPSGTDVIIGWKDGYVNIPVFASPYAMGTYIKSFQDSYKAEITGQDSSEFGKISRDFIASDKVHMYKSGTPGRIMSVFYNAHGTTVYVVRIENKSWFVLDHDVNLPGTAPPVVATPKETKDSLLEKRHGFAGMTYRIDEDDY